MSGSNVARSLLAKPARILMVGAPGAGKGTFASRLCKLWQLPHIATGDIIREEQHKGTDLGKRFKEYTSKGLLVPDEVVNELSHRRLTQPDALAQGYILDGYPRTVAQAEALSQFAPPHLCINITLPDKHLVKKISGRRVCRKCGANFNVATISDGPYDMPPLLPSENDGSPCGVNHDLYQREDDTEQTVVKRLEVYKRETSPLINFYSKIGVLKSFEVYKGVGDLGRLTDLILDSLSNHHPVEAADQTKTTDAMKVGGDQTDTTAGLISRPMAKCNGVAK